LSQACGIAVPLVQVLLLAVPLQKLTPKKDIVDVTSVGDPNNMLRRVGNFLTGSAFDEDRWENEGTQNCNNVGRTGARQT
jgi:hypothetical protein